MASFKSHPVFSSLIVLCGLAALAEVYLIIPVTKLPYNQYAAKVAAEEDLATKQKTLDDLKSKVPAPSEENKKKIEEMLKTSIAARDQMRAVLKGHGDFAEKLRAEAVPAEATDAYFNITQFVDSTRAKITRINDGSEHKIKIKDDERFSFATYKTEGPVGKDIIAQVFHQRQVIEYLVETLLAAKPAQLVSIKREVPLTKAERDARDKAIATAKERHEAPPAVSAGTTGVAEDFFAIDPLITARRPEFVETEAFRIEFIGISDSLRSLLNKLALFELPLVVRSVEVEPSSVVDPVLSQAEVKLDDNGNALKPDLTAAPKVQRFFSKFTVIIEYIDLVPDKI